MFIRVRENPYFDIATLLKSHFGKGVSCKFAIYFQNTFYYEHLWVAACK